MSFYIFENFNEFNDKISLFDCQKFFSSRVLQNLKNPRKHSKFHEFLYF